MMLFAILLFAIRIPKGTPIRTDSKLENKTSVKVNIKSSQSPWLWMNQRPTTEKMARPNFFPEARNASSATNAIRMTAGMAVSVDVIRSINVCEDALIGSNRKLNVSAVLSVMYSVKSATGNSGMKFNRLSIYGHLTFSCQSGYDGASDKNTHQSVVFDDSDRRA